MENFIVKFKNNLKKIQSTRKKILKECEQEISIIQKLLDEDPSVLKEINHSTIEEKLLIATTIGSLNLAITEFMNKSKGKRKKKKAEKETIQIVYDDLLKFIEMIKKEYIVTQNIINAFENDKIKDPINNIETLFHQMCYTTLTLEEISKIIGMAITFNSQYAKRNKNHKIENINYIHQLALDYYNPDGTFKDHIDIKIFERNMRKLFKEPFDGFEIINRIFSTTTVYTIDDLIAFYFESNHQYKNEQNIDTKDTFEISQNEDYTISAEVRQALQELKKYYKNGSIIAIPSNLDEFYSILENTNLDEQEKKYITNLLNEEISKARNLTISKFLSPQEQEIYTTATKLLDKFTYSNKDVYTLKQLIEEIQTILQFLEEEPDEELLSEIPIIIEQLSIICNRYKDNDTLSTNHLLFLQNKNQMSYIFEDIDSLDPIYKKAIYSLINKIKPENKSQFRKILINEPLPYSMYEVISPRAHVAFVEIDAGIYVIMGANIPRSGYKELNNRLKAHIKELETIETIVKNPNTRNQILKDNEQYSLIFSEEKDINQNESNKFTLKPHN